MVIAPIASLKSSVSHDKYAHLDSKDFEACCGSAWPLLASTVWLLPAASRPPVHDWLQSLAPDAAGGLAVGCALVAQSIAHAHLSGVSLIHGLYSCVVPPMVYMLFGTNCRGMIGTGCLIALITGAELERYEAAELRAQAAVVLTALAGLALVGMGALRSAGLARCMSRPAMSGSASGAALLIVTSQLPSVLGLAKQRFIPQLMSVASGEQTVHSATAALSILALGWLVGVRRLAQAWPESAHAADVKEIVLMVAATVFCATFGADLGIEVVGDVPAHLPRFELPRVSGRLVDELFPGAVLLAVTIFASSSAAARRLGAGAGCKPDASSELRGLGLANAVGACFGALPTQLSPGPAHSCGAKSRPGVSFVAVGVAAATLATFAPLFHHLPRCVLSCVVMSAATSLCDFHHPIWLYKLSTDRYDLKDLFVWVVAFVVTLVWGASKGMLCAMVVSVVLVLLEVAEPNVAEVSCEVEAGAKWRSNDNSPPSIEPGIIVVRAHGALFYANAECFRERVEAIELRRLERGELVHSAVLDFGCVPSVDASVVEVLKEMISRWAQRGTEIRIANAVGRTKSVLEKEFAQSLGQESLELDVEEAYCELLNIQLSRLN